MEHETFKRALHLQNQIKSAQWLRRIIEYANNKKSTSMTIEFYKDGEDVTSCCVPADLVKGVCYRLLMDAERFEQICREEFNSL